MQFYTIKPQNQKHYLGCYFLKILQPSYNNILQPSSSKMVFFFKNSFLLSPTYFILYLILLISLSLSHLFLNSFFYYLSPLLGYIILLYIYYFNIGKIKARMLGIGYIVKCDDILNKVAF